MWQDNFANNFGWQKPWPLFLDQYISQVDFVLLSSPNLSARSARECCGTLRMSNHILPFSNFVVGILTR